jgi:GNAT superfamily N-acetyltransferase
VCLAVGMTASLMIETAVPDDAGEILTVQRAAYVSEPRLHDAFDLPPLVESLDEIRAAFDTALIVKAVRRGRIVGAARGRIDGDTCHIGRIAVAPDMQGHGIGTLLIGAIEERTTTLVRRWELFTGPLSDHNVRLYRRLGYVDIPSRPGHEELRFLAKPVP